MRRVAVDFQLKTVLIVLVASYSPIMKLDAQRVELSALPLSIIEKSLAVEATWSPHRNVELRAVLQGYPRARRSDRGFFTFGSSTRASGYRYELAAGLRLPLKVSSPGQAFVLGPFVQVTELMGTSNAGCLGWCAPDRVLDHKFLRVGVHAGYRLYVTSRFGLGASVQVGRLTSNINAAKYADTAQSATVNWEPQEYEVIGRLSVRWILLER